MTRSLGNVTIASKLMHHTPRSDHGQVKQVAWYRPRYLLQAKREREREREIGTEARQALAVFLHPAIYLFYMVSCHLQMRVGTPWHESATGFLSNSITTRWNSYSSKLGPTLVFSYSFVSFTFASSIILCSPFFLCLFGTGAARSRPFASSISPLERILLSLLERLGYDT